MFLKCGSSRQTRKKRRQACFEAGGSGRKTRRKAILTKYDAARRILITLSYKLAAYGGELAATEAMNDLVSLGVEIHEAVDEKIRIRAGFFKIRYPFLSLADAICIALAERLRGVVITTDRPFANVKENLRINLIR